MIRRCELSDYDNILRIWSEAFGDTKEDIINFLNKFKECVYILDKDAIMTLFPVILNNKRGHYIYAVAVDSEKRGMGLGKKLIEFAKANMENFLVLVPADKGLFDYYRKLGFCENSAIGIYDKTKANEKISAKEYFELRDKHFNGRNYIKWSEEQLSQIA